MQLVYLRFMRRVFDVCFNVDLRCRDEGGEAGGCGDLGNGRGGGNVGSGRGGVFCFLSVLFENFTDLGCEAASISSDLLSAI